MKVGVKDILVAMVLIFIIIIMNYFYYEPSVYIAKNYGTVLSDNWWNALNWIKNNTKECAVIATYWDPGHFITGIARRHVVFDGASQNEVLIIEKNGTNITRARIQDIATTLFTDNETEAIDILRDYLICDEMYYIASSDLIQKSQWWTYFSTWNPIDYGTMYIYSQSNLMEAKPLIGEDAISYRYYAGRDKSGQDHFYVIYEKAGALVPTYQAGNLFLQIENLVNMDDGRIWGNEDAEILGTVLLFNQKQFLIHVPEELENSIFTRMFFFNGQGLEHFEFVRSWGGEIKLFKVLFD